jgi:voltage-gated potassium channel
MAEEERTTEEKSGRLVFPHKAATPVRAILMRLLIAGACVVATTAIVFLEREGYSNTCQDTTTNQAEECTLETVLDAAYYATVTLSTTGYGDIAPVSEVARLTNIILITPLRFLFLIVLVGTTIEVLTQRTQYEWRAKNWRKKMTEHTVVIGFGIKGRSAAIALRDSGIPANKIVVVGYDDDSVRDAVEEGFTVVQGDARRETVLEQAEIGRANRIVIATDQDATSVLVTMLAKRLSPNATIVSAARETSNAQFLRDSGADGVIVTAEAIGRLLSLSLVSPTAGNLMEDLLDSGRGLEMVERDITAEELGTGPEQIDAQGELVLAVIRDGDTHRFDERVVKALNRGDKIVVIRESRDSDGLEVQDH